MKAKAAMKAAPAPVVPFADFAARIRAVARGDAGVPGGAGTKVHSSELARQQWTAPALIKHAKLAAFIKLLADNEDLLAAIRDKHPRSVTELAKQVKRSDSNVSRTLGKLVKYGIVRMEVAHGRAKRPDLMVDKMFLEVNVRSGQIAISSMWREPAAPSRSGADHVPV
jgi:predicted transcriptional regulator